IDIKQKVTVVRDAIRVEYTVKNGDSQPHNIGFMQLLNVQVPVGNATRTVFWVPNVGRVDSEAVYSGLYVPTYVQAADDFPTSSVANVVATFGDWDATPPTTVLIANADSIAGASDVWDYQPVGISVIGSAVLALKWQPTWVSPNSTCKFVFYYGVDWSTNMYYYPIGSAIYSPLTPSNSFTLTCYLYNAGNYPISGAQATINLPNGLTLAQNDTSSKSFPTILPRASATAPDPEANLSWVVQISPDTVGHLPVEVDINVPGFNETIKLIRYIDIPVGYKKNISAGVSMLSVPFAFADSTTDKVLSSLGMDLTRKVARWSSKLNRYLFYPDDKEMGNIVPGRAFWIKADSKATLDVSGQSPQPVPWWIDYPIQLEAGWNQIGNPFVYTIPWGSVKVQYMGQTKGWSEAISAGWLRDFIFHWNPTTNSYELKPEFYKNGTYPLEPWEGYFIKTTVPCNLVFSALSIPQPPSQTATATKDIRDVLSARWLIQLVFLSGNVRDEANYIGVGREEKIEKPPSPLDSYINIVKDGERLACDVRSSTAQKVWTIEVNAPQGGEIIWKGMERLPKGLRLYLVDENGNRIYMGTTSSYKVEGKRILKIEAVEGNGKAMIIGLRVVPQRGGVSVAFSLSAEAMVNVKVMTASGKAVK
ncbi:MAG: hypothetical protein ACP5QS_07715, partial [bacterium]